MPPRDDAGPGGPLRPLLLRPRLIEKPWGGDRLARFPAKGVLAGSRIGETWEASGLAGHDSLVASGPFEGVGLAELTAREGHRLVGADLDGQEFPLLVKFIDARESLSVQVHPPQRLDGPARVPGKAEAWYVLEAGEIVLGLEPHADLEALERALRAGGDPSAFLSRVRVEAGQTIPVPPGTIHAIGPGVLVLEIQQPADITYRVYDWGRTDRALHVDEAMAVLDPLAGHQKVGSPLEWSQGRNARRFHAGCRHFAIESARFREPAPWIRAARDAVEVLVCLQGAFHLGPPGSTGSSGPEGADRGSGVRATAGDTVVIPAASGDLWIEPEGETELVLCYPCRQEREIYERLLTCGFAGDAVAQRIFAA